jgi:hypothetical protein
MANPEGIESLSPGLRVRELPWGRIPKDHSTLKGLHPGRRSDWNPTPSGLSKIVVGVTQGRLADSPTLG